MEELTKFYEWMRMINNIHLANNERMSRAYEIIINNQKQLRK